MAFGWRFRLFNASSVGLLFFLRLVLCFVCVCPPPKKYPRVSSCMRKMVLLLYLVGKGDEATNVSNDGLWARFVRDFPLVDGGSSLSSV